MANPNLVNVTTITAKSLQAALTTTLTTQILENAAASGKVFKINNIIIANIDGTSSVDISVFITKSGGSPVAIASTVSVPADSTLIAFDKNSSIYLEEGDNIEAERTAGLECSARDTNRRRWAPYRAGRARFRRGVGD